MLIIGIAGGTGSGKTTVVNNILNNLNSQNVLVISQDNYYKAHNDLSFAEREKINFDHPRSIDFDLLTENIQDLRSEEHTSELQSRGHLVCRLLLEKKKKIKTQNSLIARR